MTRLQRCVHTQNAKFLCFSSIPHSLNGDRLHTCAFQSPSRMHAENNVELLSSQYSPTDLANHDVSIDTCCLVFVLISSPPWSYAGISFRLAINAKGLHPGELHCGILQVKFLSGSEKSLRRFISQIIRPEGP